MTKKKGVAKKDQDEGGKLITIGQGEASESLAAKHGHFWPTIWDHQRNAKLKEERKDAHTLFPGDEVFIPDLRRKESDGATEKRHKFRRKGMPSFLRVVVRRGKKPRAGEPYRLTVDNETREGMTGRKGKIEEWIDPLAKKGLLVVGEGDEATEYRLLLRHLDPVTQPSGVNARLHNLGYLRSHQTHQITPATKAALERFQGDHGLTADGELTDETRQKLVEAHGC
jgi:N-acetylmuramoyl-L-alanine amidase